MRAWFCFLFLFGLFLFATAAQSPAAKSSTGSVAGRVTRGDKPLAGMQVLANRVTLYGGWQPNGTTAKTDEDGRYQLTNLSTGQYLITVRALADVMTSNDAMNQGKPVLVQDGEAIENVDFSLAKGGVITGTVTDENGQPLVETMVRLLRKVEPGPSINYYSSSLYLMNKTDDRGVYRLFGLPPGKYLVWVGNEQDDGSPQRRYGGTYYPQTFAPGVTQEAEAKAVSVTGDSESKDVDIKLGKAEKTYTAKGRILDATTGVPLAGVRVGHTKFDRDGQFGNVGLERTNAQGEFQISGLSPGSHSVYLAADEGVSYYTEPKKFALLNSDVTGLELKALPGSTLSGVVVIEGTKDPALLASLRSLALFVNSNSGENQVSRSTTVSLNPDGSFRVLGLSPGKVRFNLGMRGGVTFAGPRPFILRTEKDGKVWPEEASISAGENASNMRVVVGYGVGVVRGQVTVIGGQLADVGQVRVNLNALPRSGSTRDARNVVTDAQGRFYIEGLLPGDYQIIANFNAPLAAGKRRKPPLPQPLTVTGEKETHITLTIDLTEEGK